MIVAFRSHNSFQSSGRWLYVSYCETVSISRKRMLLKSIIVNCVIVSGEWSMVSGQLSVVSGELAVY